MGWLYVSERHLFVRVAEQHVYIALSFQDARAIKTQREIRAITSSHRKGKKIKKIVLARVKYIDFPLPRLDMLLVIRTLQKRERNLRELEKDGVEVGIVGGLEQEANMFGDGRGEGKHR